MKKYLWILLILILGGAQAARASDVTSTPTLTPTVTLTPGVPKPLVFQSKDRLWDSTHFSLPHPPRKSADGAALDLANEEENAPQGPALLNLTGSVVFAQIPEVNKADNHSGQYVWHVLQDFSYCHHPDGNRNWYGWNTDGTFHWVLWWSGRFWWYDSYAERWLYFDQGYWWWQSLKNPNEIQVYMQDGHYHACDANGVLGDDLMKTGQEETVTEPVVRTTPLPTPPMNPTGSSGGMMGGGMGGL